MTFMETRTKDASLTSLGNWDQTQVVWLDGKLTELFYLPVRNRIFVGFSRLIV